MFPYSIHTSLFTPSSSFSPHHLLAMPSTDKSSVYYLKKVTCLQPFLTSSTATTLVLDTFTSQLGNHNSLLVGIIISNLVLLESFPNLVSKSMLFISYNGFSLHLKPKVFMSPIKSYMIFMSTAKSHLQTTSSLTLYHISLSSSQTHLLAVLWTCYLHTHHKVITVALLSAKSIL